MTSSRSDRRRSSHARVRALATIAAGLALAACADLSASSANTCGNDVIETGEDCDGHSSSPSASCAPPGTAHACRYLCGASAKVEGGLPASCPDGFLCGVADGVCRQPTGQYQSLSASDPVSAMSLFAADFDGNGEPLLFALGDDLGDGRRLGRLVDPVGTTLGAGSPVSQAMASPAVSDLDGDGHQDIAFVDYSGIGVLRGNPVDEAPSFLSLPWAPPSSESKHLRAIALPVATGPQGQDPGDQILTIEDDGSSLGFHRVDAHDPPLVDLTFTGKQIADLAGGLMHARFDARPSSSCDHVVTALCGLDRVLLFAPCTSSGWADPGLAPSAVVLPSTASVAGPALAIDVDSDGALDLVVATTLGPYVAFGRGDGTFSSTSGSSGPDGIASPLALSWLLGETPATTLPLAAIDLNGDGLTDFVFSSGVTLTDPDAGGALYWALRSAGWTEAQAGSGTRGPFIVAASSSVGLDVLWYAGDTRQLVDQEVPTTTIAAHLVLGDFDGDRVTDVAFAQQGGGLGDSWAVAFSVSTRPVAPVAMGAFDSITELSAAHLAEPYVGADGVSDLVISTRIDPPASQASTPPTETLVTSLGSATRQMIALFPLRDATGAQALPLAVAAAPILGFPSLAALGAVDPQGAATLRLWIFPPSATAVSSLVLSDPLPAAFHASRFGGDTVTDLRYGAHLATADLDGDGADEIVMVAPYGPDESQSAFVVANVHGTQIVLSDPVVFEGESTLYSVLRLADVDSDGAADVVFKPLDDTPQDVIVFWNDGHGGFSADRQARLQVPGGINDFVCLDDGDDCDLFLVGVSKTYSVEVGADRSFTVTEVAGLPGGAAVTSGDFDGDGLSDLAIGSVDSLQVFDAIARLP